MKVKKEPLILLESLDQVGTFAYNNFNKHFCNSLVQIKICVSNKIALSHLHLKLESKEKYFKLNIYKLPFFLYH